MQKKTYVERPDGTKVTTYTKTGFVVRDAMFMAVGGAAGLFMGVTAAPIISSILPRTITSSAMASKAVVGIGSTVIGEVTEHSIVRALTDIAEFSDGVVEDFDRKKEVVKEETTAESEKAETKTTVSKSTVRQAKK